MKRFEVRFIGCPSCGKDDIHYSVIDTMGQFKPELGHSGKSAAEKLAEILNERWEEVKDEA